MMDLLKAIYNNDKVRKAALVLAGAIGVVVAQHFGLMM